MRLQNVTLEAAVAGAAVAALAVYYRHPWNAAVPFGLLAWVAVQVLYWYATAILRGRGGR